MHGSRRWCRVEARRQTTYHDPGADYYDRRHIERARRRAIHALERQGYRVILEPAA